MYDCTEYRFDELATIKYGKNQKAVESPEGTIPIYGAGGLMGYATKPLYEKPSVLIGRKGTINKVKFTDRPFWTVDTLFYTEINENIVFPKFLFYKLSLVNFMNYNEGTTIPSLRTETLNRLVFDIPNLEVQKKIITVLSSLDDKIELNNRINDNLEQQAQAIFKSWFVDFEPFGGEMPDNWQKCKAEEYFEISIGKTPPRKEQEWFSVEKTAQTMKWVSISDMGSCGLFISDSSEYLTTAAVETFNIKVVPANTVLLSFKLTVGRIAITDDEMCTNEAIAHFVTNNKTINEYLYLYLKNFNYQTMGSTSSIAIAVNSKIIKAMPFIAPDKDTIDKFHLVTNPLFEKIRKNQLENRTLTTIRNSLLPKLMSGELDVDSVQL